MGQNEVTFWDRRSWYLILSYNEMNYGKEQGAFLEQEKLTYGHNKTNFWTEQGYFLGQEKLILGLNKMNYMT